MKYVFIVCLMAGAAAAADAPKRLTLHDAEEIALKNNPAVHAAGYSALAANEVPSEVAAARYPTLTGSLTGAGAPDNSRLAAGGLNNPVIFSRLATGLTVSQLLLDFGRTSKLIESSRYSAQAEQETANAARSQTIMDVDKAYYVALRTEAVLRVANQTVQARQLTVDQVSALAKASLKSGLDLSFAQVNLADAKLLLAQAQNEKQAAYANLSAALGYETTQNVELVEEPFQIEPLALSELIGKALRERPDLRARNLEVQAANRFAGAEKALKYPSISAIASAGWLPQRDPVLRSDYAAAGINVNLPFLNGGLYHAREAEASLRARAAEEREKDLKTRVIRDIKVALLNVNTAAERVGLTAMLLDQSAQALDLAQSRYDLGLSSIVELSQAQLARTSAEIQNANAKYDYQIQRAVLDYAVGSRH